MSITVVPSVVTGQTYSAANYNTQVRDNINGIWVLTTAGDMLYATGAAAANRLALVVGGIMYGGASAPAWLAKPASEGLLKNDNAGVPSWLTGGTAYKVVRRNLAATGFELGVPVLQCCVVQMNASTSVIAGGTIAWDGTDIMDDYGWHNPSSNPSRITVTETGIYKPEAKIGWYVPSGGTTENYLATFKKNGTLLESPAVNVAGHRNGEMIRLPVTSEPLALTAGDYIEVEINLHATYTIQKDYSRMWLTRIG